MTERQTWILQAGHLTPAMPGHPKVHNAVYCSMPVELDGAGQLLHTVIRSYLAAVGCFVWARALEPTNGALCHQLGCALTCAGRHSDAAAAHHEAAAVYTSTVAPAEHIAEQFYLAANALQLCSSSDAAIKAYNAALAVVPCHRKALMAKVSVSANSCWVAAACQRVSKPELLESPYRQVRLPGDATNALHGASADLVRLLTHFYERVRSVLHTRKRENV